MKIIDVNQNRALGVMVAVVTIITAFIGTLAYVENKRHNKINDEVLNLDREIKRLELAKKKAEASADGINV
jgi:hypothetical protein